MGIKSFSLSSLACATLLSLSAGPALADGELTVINCYDKNMYVGAADWDDASGGWVPFSHAWLKPGERKTLKCYKTWTDSHAKGCKVVLGTDDTSYGTIGLGRKESGNYFSFYSKHDGCYVFMKGSTCPSYKSLMNQINKDNCN